MQSASDLFLGWATGPQGRQFHLRKLRNVKLCPLVETYDAEMLSIYAKAAAAFWRERMRKRAVPGRLVAIWASRMNSTRRWVNFPSSYTDQAERDHAALAAAVRAGAIDVNLSASMPRSPAAAFVSQKIKEDLPSIRAAKEEHQPGEQL